MHSLEIHRGPEPDVGLTILTLGFPSCILVISLVARFFDSVFALVPQWAFGTSHQVGEGIPHCISPRSTGLTSLGRGIKVGGQGAGLTIQATRASCHQVATHLQRGTGNAGRLSGLRLSRTKRTGELETIHALVPRRHVRHWTAPGSEYVPTAQVRQGESSFRPPSLE